MNVSNDPSIALETDRTDASTRQRTRFAEDGHERRVALGLEWVRFRFRFRFRF